MEFERSKAADASAAVLTRVRVLACGALEDRVVRDGAGIDEEDATALFDDLCCKMFDKPFEPSGVDLRNRFPKFSNTFWGKDR